MLGVRIPPQCLKATNGRDYLKYLLEANGRKLKRSHVVRITITYRKDLFTEKMGRVSSWVAKNSDLFSTVGGFVCFAGETPKEKVKIRVQDSPFDSESIQKTLDSLQEANRANQLLIHKEQSKTQKRKSSQKEREQQRFDNWFPYYSHFSQQQRQKLKARGESVPDSMKESRRTLPSYSKRTEILNLIHRHQVTVILGSTGCGKTTQVPQYILEDRIDGESKQCGVICTQPRRISAISIAERVAEERNESLGDTVGYQIRFDSHVSRSTRLSFCTHGTLLRRLISDPELTGVTHVILDEIHERDCLTDFCMMVLRDLINGRRPDLKLVLMSATMDPTVFTQYFHSDETATFEIPGFTYPVEEYHLEDVLHYTGYYLPAMKMKDRNDTVLYDLNEYDTWDSGFDADEERFEILSNNDNNENNNNENNFTMNSNYESQSWSLEQHADRLKRRNQFLSRSVKDHHLTSKFHQLRAQWGNTFPRETIETLSVFSLFEETHIHFPLIVSLVEKIHTTEASGGVLIFLPKWDAINTLLQELEESSLSSEWSIHVAHSMVSVKDQRSMFAPPPSGKRKIVLSTNIAETSITINDIVYVIDTGLVNEKGYNETTDTSTLQSRLISKANAQQRRGRAGRVRPGKLYRLFTEETYRQHMDEFQVPEMQRTSVEELCLMVKGLGLDDSSRFIMNENSSSSLSSSSSSSSSLAPTRLSIQDVLSKAVSPPSSQSIKNAIELLTFIDGIDHQENLTVLGQKLAQLPIHPQLGKMIIIGAMFGCLEPILTISAAIVSKSPFILIPGREKQIDQVKQSFAGNKGGDHLMLLNVYRTWQRLRRSKKPSAALSKFYERNFISSNAMWMIEKTRRQLRGLIRDFGMRGDFDRNGSNDALIQSIVGLGLYPNVLSFWVKPRRRGRPILKLHTGTARQIRVHPGSIMGSGVDPKDVQPPFVVYYDMVQNGRKIYIRDGSGVEALPLVMFYGRTSIARELRVDDGNSHEEEEDDEKDEKDEEHLGHFTVKFDDDHHLELIQKLRSEVSTLFNNKLMYPSLVLDREFDSLGELFSKTKEIEKKEIEKKK